jgi:hypothetical protein
MYHGLMEDLSTHGLCLCAQTYEADSLVKICGIRQANRIHILDEPSALWPLSLNLKHQSFLLLD